jgi:hypothetical protein
MWFFPTAGAAIFGFFLKKSSLLENGPTGPMLGSDSTPTILSGWPGISFFAIAALIVVAVIEPTSTSRGTAASPVQLAPPTVVTSLPSSAVPVGWKVNETLSEMDGTREVSLAIEATNHTDGYSGSKKPTLEIRCANHRPEIFVNVGGPFQSIYYSQFNGTRVRLKFDDAAPILQTWTEATDNEAAFPPNPAMLVRQLEASQVFRFEFTPSKKRETIATFNIRDLQNKLQPIAEVCGLNNGPVKKMMGAGPTNEVTRQAITLSPTMATSKPERNISEGVKDEGSRVIQ